MKGAEMMLKAMGLDPDELKNQFGGMVQGIQTKFVQLENQLQRIEVTQMTIMAQNTAILNNMRALADALHIEGVEHVETDEQFRIDFQHGDDTGHGRINGN